MPRCAAGDTFFGLPGLRRTPLASLFLGCFAFGLIFTVASFALGAFGGPDLQLSDYGHGDGGGPGGSSDPGAHLSPFSLSTISAFVTWFGAAGWLLTRYSTLTAALVFLVASAAGLAGGAIVFLVIARYLFPRLTVMRPADYVEQGVVGHLASPIREGGTGEVVYLLGGARRVDSARTLHGEALERGTEVVIHKVERGIAWVEKWDEFARANQLPAGDRAAPQTGES